MIQVKELAFSYEQGKQILKNLSFQVEKGETVGIIGANGVGKSTLLRLMVGLLSGYSGELRVDGLSVEKCNLQEIRKRVGFVFQDADSQLFLSTVYEDVAFGPRNLGCDHRQVEERVQKALELVNMTDCRNQQIYKLSGGQKKMASIATVLAMSPEIVLLDEPAVALDPRNRSKLIQVLSNMPETKMIASHDMDFISRLCDKVLLLDQGQCRAFGRTREILENPTLLEESGMLTDS